MKKPFRLKQVSVRLVPERPLVSETAIHSPEDAVKLMQEFLSDFDRECVCVVSLAADCRPVNFSVCSIGTLTCAVIEPRDLIKVLCLSNATRFLLIHNHPGGSLAPSKEDIETTDRMYKIGSLINVPLCDHIIVAHGKSEYYSFMEKGIMNFEKMQVESCADKLRANQMVAETITPRKRNAKEHDER